MSTVPTSSRTIECQTPAHGVPMTPRKPGKARLSQRNRKGMVKGRCMLCNPNDEDAWGDGKGDVRIHATRRTEHLLCFSCFLATFSTIFWSMYQLIANREKHILSRDTTIPCCGRGDQHNMNFCNQYTRIHPWAPEKLIRGRKNKTTNMYHITEVPQGWVFLNTDDMPIEVREIRDAIDRIKTTRVYQLDGSDLTLCRNDIKCGTLCELQNDRNSTYKKVECKSCNTDWCHECGAFPYHTYTSCAQHKRETDGMDPAEKKMFDAGLMRWCIKCGLKIEKIDGCNDIYHRGCGGHTCWTCGTDLSTDRNHEWVNDTFYPCREPDYQFVPRYLRQHFDHTTGRMYRTGAFFPPPDDGDSNDIDSGSESEISEDESS